MEREIGPGLRLLLGVIGTVAIVAAVIVVNGEVRSAISGSPLAPTIFVAGFCAIVIAGGAALIRGAARGRIRFRRVRFERRTH